MRLQREHVFYWEPEDVWYRQQERYFVARVPAHEVVTRYQEPGEAQFMTAHRWWTPAELHASPDRLVPGDFAILFDALQHDGAPSQPVVVGL